jgi:hypothetical protein
MTNKHQTSLHCAITIAQSRANDKQATHIVAYRKRTKTYLIRRQTHKNVDDDLQLYEDLMTVIEPIKSTFTLREQTNNVNKTNN